jgi:hypothetical protein
VRNESCDLIVSVSIRNVHGTLNYMRMFHAACCSSYEPNITGR